MSFASLQSWGNSFIYLAFPNGSMSKASRVALYPGSSLSKNRTTSSNDSINSRFALNAFSTRLAPGRPDAEARARARASGPLRAADHAA